MKIILVFLLVLASNIVMSRDYKKLDSDYAINGGYDIDWEVKPGKTHMYLWIKGESALNIYESLESSEKIDECLGAQSKMSGNIYCVKADSIENTFCAFGINLKTNEIVQGSTC